MGMQDGAHVCAIYVRIRDGVRRPSSTLCHWLGGTRRSSGRGLCRREAPVCPVSRKGKHCSIKEGHKGKRVPGGSTYREERRTCCDNDAHLSHQLVPTWPRVAVGGGPPSPSFPEQAKRPTWFGSRGTTAPLIRARQGHGTQQRKYNYATARPTDPDARFRFIGWESGALARYCNAPLLLPCSVLPLDAPISARRTTPPCARLEKA